MEVGIRHNIKTNIKLNLVTSVLVSIIMFISMATVSADSEPMPTSAQVVVSPDQAKAIHADLRKLRDTMEKALNENDFATILAHVDENVVFLAMNAEVVTGQEDLGKYYKKMMEGPDKIIDSIKSTFVADELSILHEEDMAIAHGHSDTRYELTIGKTLDVKGIWSSTLIYRDGAWKIASFHYSVNMFDNPIVKAQSKMLWIVGAGGALLALVAFLLGRRRK